MRMLAIETAVSPGSVAVVETEDAGVLAHRSLSEDQRTAQSLAPAIVDVLAELGWSARSLELIAASVGPGSFTGLRIGVTAAKTIGYAAGAQCVPLGTLAVLAAQARGPEGGETTGWAALDAGRGEVFAATFAEPRNVLLLPRTEWLARLRPGDRVAGPIAWSKRDELPGGVEPCRPEQCSPDASSVARLAMETPERCTPFELAPQYHRLSAAEEKLLDQPKPGA